MEICAGLMGTDTFDADAFEKSVKGVTVLPDGSIEMQFFGREIKVW